jgi:molybdopterin molybdotransferase
MSIYSVADAVGWVDREFERPAATERIPPGEALGRIAACDLRAECDGPPFDRVLTDGYALRAEETLGAAAYNPLSLPATPVAAGFRLPAGNDAVVPLDHVAEYAGAVEVIEPVAVGANIERRGDDFCRGTTVLRAGHRIGAADLALLASAGIAQVDVVRRPRIRLVVTGRALVRAGEELPIGAVYDADTPLLCGLIERDGGTVEILRVDRRAAEPIRDAIEAPSTEMVVVVGGTGLGADDLALRSALAPPASLSIPAVALRPGSTIAIGHLGRTPLFLLPGSPVHCLWAYEILVGRVVRRLAGRSRELPFAAAEFETARKIVSSIGFVEICPVRRIDGGNRIEPVSGAAADGPAGLFATVVEADGFVLVPEASEGFAPGTRVPVFLYDKSCRGGQRT